MPSDSTSDFGPQNAKDAPFTAQMRRHQSWYRAQMLRVPYGAGPRPTNKTFFGNMLSAADGQERGLNFLTPHIFAVAKRRAVEKKGALDVFRLFCNLLSSQALAFNLFAPLVDDRELASALARSLLPDEVRGVHRVAMGFAPYPPGEYLNDLTAFDALIEYSRPDHSRAFLGIATRLAEDAPHKARLTPAYRALAEQAGSPWDGADLVRLAAPEVNALWHGHLLAEALLRHPRSKYAAGSFAVVYHPQDAGTAEAIAAYRALLRPAAAGAAFRAFPLDQLIAAWQPRVETVSQRRWLSDFSIRYLDLSASEAEEEKIQHGDHGE